MIRRLVFALILITITWSTQACGVPVAAAVSAPPGLPVRSQPAQTPAPVYVTVPPDATATPTPFQPLPPTAVFIPPDVSLPTATPSPTSPVILAPPQDSVGQQPELAQPPGQINVLLLGADARPGWGNFRTDTIILATINTELGTVNMTSFPRDLWVSIPGQGQNRINTAYFFGKYPMLAETFKYNFGIRPDHYVLINFSSFKDVIDNLGGLDVYVDEPLSDYRSGYYVTIPKGEVHMDADTVLWYVRSRKTTNDFARNRRQQEILRAIFDKMVSMDAIRRAPEFYSVYKDNVTTDMTLYDLVSLLPLAAQLAGDSRRIRQYYIGPGYLDGWVTPEGAMVLLPRMDKIRQLLREAQNIQ